MVHYHCVPDAVTFTALISAYEKGVQDFCAPSMWQRALHAYEHVRPKTSPMWGLGSRDQGWVQG